MTTNYQIKIHAFRAKEFQTAKEIIKRAGGVYNPDTKTWTVEIDPEYSTLMEHLDAYSRSRGSIYADCYEIV